MVFRIENNNKIFIINIFKLSILIIFYTFNVKKR